MTVGEYALWSKAPKCNLADEFWVVTNSSVCQNAGEADEGQAVLTQIRM